MSYTATDPIFMCKYSSKHSSKQFQQLSIRLHVSLVYRVSSAILHTGNSVYTVLTLYIRINAITTNTNYKHYAVYTQDPDYVRIMRVVRRLGFEYEIHIMRTRFWVPATSKYNSLFALRCVEVSDEIDHSTGLKHISEI